MEGRKKFYIAFSVEAVVAMVTVFSLMSICRVDSSRPTVIEEKRVRNLFVQKKLSLVTVSLANVDEFSFNDGGKYVKMVMSHPMLDTNNYAVLMNGQSITNTSSTKDSITVSGTFNASTFFSLFALDAYGLPIFTSFHLYFGLITVPVHIMFTNKTAVVGVMVSMNLTDNPHVGQTGITDDDGMIIFKNVPQMTVSIFASTKDNQIAFGSIIPSTFQINLTLIPFNNDKHANELENLQHLGVTTSEHTISRTFMTKSNANKAFVEYQFVTSKVSEDFSDSDYNDYFSVILRSDRGQYITKTDSVKRLLGLNTFNLATNATSWNNLTLKIDAASERIRVDVGIFNVGNGRYPSSINVRAYGSDQCTGCDKNCVKCTSDPMCRNTCMNPPMQSCAFYSDCMEEKVACGPNGYALGYGMKYCMKFSNTLQSFSPRGQRWIWDTMNCLQKTLVSPLKNCENNCSILRKTAFDSHPGCYVKSGVCELPAFDWITIASIVGKDIFSSDGFIQALKTVPQCIPDILERISLLLVEETLPYSERIALMVLEAWLRSL
ncbi:unnamed protein product [Adineta steineri]|uniref:Uncharacterized protein n=1 Tax=Adineta steineri TaxID=433720 RepID=A0A819DML2_9BILA|nr:unnamed protein product [Adineta steineri]CAF3832267.1 unnamed protein product [Adineta steineri]